VVASQTKFFEVYKADKYEELLIDTAGVFDTEGPAVELANQNEIMLALI